LRVKEIMDSKYPVIYRDELATKARAIIRDFSLRILPVTDENKKVLGIVTRSDVMAISSSVSPIKVRGIIKPLKHLASLEDDAFLVVKEMIRLDEWYVPVVNSTQDSRYRGVLGLANFIEALIRTSPEKLSKDVSEVMSKEVVTCTPDDEVEQVWRLMQEQSLSGFPVVKNGKLVGMVTQKDLLESGGMLPGFESTKGRFRSSPKVASIMETGVIAVEPSVKVISVAKVMVSKDIGRVPVKDRDGKLIGIIDREDIARMVIK
jgi:CBS domain-containing protein